MVPKMKVIKIINSYNMRSQRIIDNNIILVRRYITQLYRYSEVYKIKYLHTYCNL